MTLPLRVLALAANATTVGMVFLNKGELTYWQKSQTAARGPAAAVRTSGKWMAQFKPHVVVVEEFRSVRRKSERTKEIIAALDEGARRRGFVVVALARPDGYQNKYQEAAALAECYPILRPWVPTRRFYDPEPKNVVLFEALAQAKAAEHNFCLRIAAALG